MGPCDEVGLSDRQFTALPGCRLLPLSLLGCVWLAHTLRLDPTLDVMLCSEIFLSSFAASLCADLGIAAWLWPSPCPSPSMRGGANSANTLSTVTRTCPTGMQQWTSWPLAAS